MKPRWTAIRALLLGGTVALAFVAPAGAVDTLPPIPNPQLQARYLALTHELRCMQCQNESIADSPVSLATDLRREVRESLIAGQSDDQIRDRMVSRYGDFILFRPRMNARNAWLWAAPAVLLLIGVAVGVRILMQRQRLAATDAWTDTDTRSEPEADAPEANAGGTNPR
jgi:cytochrome c-type biogenesis protein CcmH